MGTVHKKRDSPHLSVAAHRLTIVELATGAALKSRQKFIIFTDSSTAPFAANCRTDLQIWLDHAAEFGFGEDFDAEFLGFFQLGAGFGADN